MWTQRQAWVGAASWDWALASCKRVCSYVRASVLCVASVLLLLGAGGWLCVSSYSVYETGDVVLSVNPFKKRAVLHRSARDDDQRCGCCSSSNFGIGCFCSLDVCNGVRPWGCWLFQCCGEDCEWACIAPGIVEFSKLVKMVKIDKQSRKARQEKALLQNLTSGADGPHERAAGVVVWLPLKFEWSDYYPGNNSKRDQAEFIRTSRCDTLSKCSMRPRKNCSSFRVVWMQQIPRVFPNCSGRPIGNGRALMRESV